MKIRWSFLCLLALVVVVGAHSRSPVKTKATYAGLQIIDFEKVKEIIKEAQQSMKLICLLASAIPGLSEQDKQDCHPCLESITLLIDDIMGMEEWALKVTDALLKPNPAILEGGFNFMSSYDACYKIGNVEVANITNYPILEKEGFGNFTTTYCSAKLSLEMDVTKIPDDMKDSALIQMLLKEKDSLEDINQLLDEFPGFFSLCIPSACSKGGINAVTKSILQVINNALGESAMIKVDYVACKTEEQSTHIDLTKAQTAAIVILFLIISIVVLCTIFDIFYLIFHGGREMKNKNFKSYEVDPETRNLYVDIPRAFSAYTNFRKLMDTRAPPGALRPLFGVKALSFIWVIIGNSLLLRAYNLTVNLKSLREALRDVVIHFTINSSLAMDSVITILGILLAYRIVKRISLKDTKRSIISFIFRFAFHFLIRLVPIYFLSLFIISTLFPIMGRGPTWDIENEKYLAKCPQNWWWNILFINNFFNRQNQCMEHTWYFAFAVQGLICSIILALIWRIKPIFGYGAAALVIVVTFLATIGLTVEYDLGPTALLREYRPGSRNDYFNIVYIKFYTRGGVFVIGMIAGYLLAMKKGMRINRVVSITAWTLSLLSFLLFLHSTYFWNKSSEHKANKGGAAFYGGIHRLVWSAAVSWMVFASALGHGGVINMFLSWPGWLPLSRLSYGLYIIHPFVMFFTNGRKKLGQFFSYETMLQELLWNIVMSVVGAVVLHLLFEAPFFRVEEYSVSSEMDDDEEDAPRSDVVNPFTMQRLTSSSSGMKIQTNGINGKGADNYAFQTDKL